MTVLSIATSLASCADPKGKFDDFVQRDEAARNRELDAGADTGPVMEASLADYPTPAQIEGTFVLFVSTVLGPTTPIANLMEVRASSQGDGLEVETRYRALSLEDRKTPVAAFSEWTKGKIDAQGRFSFEDRISTPADANAVRPGTATVADLSFNANLRDALYDDGPERLLTFWCGKVDGTLVEPIPGISFDGSSFAWVRVVDPNDWPEAVLNCAMDPAEPLK